MTLLFCQMTLDTG